MRKLLFLVVFLPTVAHADTQLLSTCSAYVREIKSIYEKDGVVYRLTGDAFIDCNGYLCNF